MQNTALYIRVSTDRQVKEGDSLEAQEVALIDYAKKNDLIIVDKYIDGGESGQKLNRTNLTRLLEDVKQGKIDLIIMTKLDRWFRSVSDFYKVQDILNKYKVKWKTIWEEYDTTTASGEFWLNVSLSLARMEAKRTGERINSVFDYKFNNQKTVCSGQKTYGYDISNDKKLIINEKEAREIIQLYEYFISCQSISETVEWYRKNIKERSYNQIKLYLKNPAYIGKYKRYRDKKIIENFSPPIIDENTFNKAQNIFKKNIRQYTYDRTKIRTYIFSGLLRCSFCNRRLKGFNSKGRNYYLCPGFYLHQGCKVRTTISERNIEKYLVNNIKSEIDKYIINSQDIVHQNKIKDNKKDLEKQLERLIDLRIRDIIDVDNYLKKRDELKKQIEEVQEVKPKDFTQLKELLKLDFENIYKILNNKEKRQIWYSIIDYIIIEKDKDPVIKFL